MDEVEAWINNSLQTAMDEKFGGLSEAVQRHKKDPLVVVELDRNTIYSHGVPPESVDRLYRSLYALTKGYYDTLHTIFAEVGEYKYILMARVWKVYETLLQFCCITDFKTMAEKMIEDKQNAIEEVKAEYDEYKRQFDLENAEVIRKLRETEAKFGALNDAKSIAEIKEKKIER